MTSATISKKNIEQYRSEPSSSEMRKEMEAFTKRLHDNPAEAKKFFQRAGILNAKGKLATPYK